MRIFFLIWLLLLPLAAQPNAKVAGNGGDVVVCRNPSGDILSIELLDYYEARELRKIHVLLPPGGSPEEIAIAALTGFAEREPERAMRYRRFVNHFSKNKVLVDGTLVDISDSNHIVVPRGCAIEQLIVRQKVLFPEDRLFIVNERLWWKMSEAQRAGAILHEAFYEEALERGATDSVSSRYFHSKAISEGIGQVSEREYLNMRSYISSHFPFTNLHGMVIGLGPNQPSDWLKQYAEDSFRFSRIGDLYYIHSPEGALNLPDFFYLKENIFRHGNFDSRCTAKEIRFSRWPTGTMVELRSIYRQSVYGDLDLACENFYVLGQRVGLKMGSSIFLSANRIRISLAEESCLRTPNAQLCGKQIVLDGSGKVLGEE
jgi:hypothetical protein